VRSGKHLDHIQQWGRPVQAGRELSGTPAQQRIQPGPRPAVRQQTGLGVVPGVFGLLVLRDPGDQRWTIMPVQLPAQHDMLQALTQQQTGLPRALAD